MMVPWLPNIGFRMRRGHPVPLLLSLSRAPTPTLTPSASRNLRRMKVVALGFLLGATVIFLLARWWRAEGGPDWLGYVAAAAEAGMVGALADWFAVTALFRHPLGLKIPHTAIIPRKKDQLGEGLGTFVRENFLSPEVISTKLRDAEIGSRLGKWLSEPVHAARVADEAATVLRAVVELLNDEDIQQVIDRTIVKRVAEPQWGPPAGRVLSQLLAENRQEALIQLLSDRAFEWALNAGPTIERVVLRDSPTWSPKFVDHLVGERIHRELMDFTDKVRRDPESRTAPVGDPVPVRVRQRPAERPVDDLQGRDRQGATDGSRRGDPRRRDGVENLEAVGARRCRRPVQRTALSDRRLGGADRGVAA